MIKAGSPNAPWSWVLRFFPVAGFPMTALFTCVLFGDGAGAVVLEASDALGILVKITLHADGKHVGFSFCTRVMFLVGRCWAILAQDGRPGRYSSWRSASWSRPHEPPLAKAGLTDADIDWLYPTPGQYPDHAKHGAQAQDAHGQGDRYCRSTWQHVGASIPLALDAGVRSGRVQPERDRLARRRGRWVHLGCSATKNVASS